MAINFRRFAVPDGSITAAKLADNAVTTAKLADSAVASAKLADSAFGSTKLADSAVSSVKLADAAVSSTKLADAAVSSTKLADAAVDSAKLADNAVVSAKLADAAVDLSTAKVGGILPVAKAHDGLRLFLIMADDTPISSNVPAVVDQWEVLKESRFSKKTATHPVVKIKFGLEFSTGGVGGGNVEWGIFLNAEATPRASGEASTSEGEFSIIDLADGIHTLKVSVKCGGTQVFGTVGLTEIYQTA